jgi:hypothetical protein
MSDRSSADPLAATAGAEAVRESGMFLVVPALGAVAATWRTVIALLGGTVPDLRAEPERSADTGAGPASPTSEPGTT